MARVTKVVVKRQCKDQVWYEAIDLQEYNWEQTHAEENTFRGSQPSIEPPLQQREA